MRKSFTPAILAACVAVAASAPAVADDNGMTPHYGDSWANVQAQDPQASPTPPTAIDQNAIDSRAAYERARSNMHNLWNRMTRTTTTESTVVASPPSDVVVAPAVVRPSGATVVAPATVVETAPIAAPPPDPAELNTGHYVDSNGNPVVPPANALPAN